ncbi:MAG: hypothetical protein Q9M31_08550 [Mariprofundus sp.]|nr:hypothetical protein [Mariprofundus sp.]
MQFVRVLAKLAGLRTVAATLSVVNLVTLQMRRRLLALPVAVLLLSLVTLTGCVADSKKISWQQDKPAVATALKDTQTAQQHLQALYQEQEKRIGTNSARIDALEALDVKYEGLQTQLLALSAQLDDLRVKAASLAKMKKRPVAKKVRRQRKKIITAPSQPLAKATPSEIADVPAVAEVVHSDVEKNAYTAAYLALKSGRYDEASSGFKAQLKRFPKGEYADQAWYWSGETKLAQGDRAEGKNAFQYVVEHYRNSVKHAASLFKLAQIAVEEKHQEKAKVYYKKLIRDHADTSMAESARAALRKLEQ